MLDYIILGFLMYGDMSGYDIKRQMTLSTSNFYDASFGSIYPMLRKMEERALIVSKEIVDSGKYKKVYSITDDGKTEFSGWLEKPIELSGTKHEHLVKVFFYDFLPKDKIIRQISEFMAYIKKTLEDLEHLEVIIKNDAHYFHKSTLKFGQGYYQFLLEWCREFLKEVTEKGEEPYEDNCFKRKP